MLRTLVLFFALTVALHAQEVDVKGSGKIPVRVLPFTGGGEAETATRVTVADLNRTLLIEAGTAANPNARATASAVWSGGTLTAQLNQGSATLFNRVYTAPSGQPRRAAHEFADDILFALTKVKGFSRARLTFISGHNGSKELYTSDIDGSATAQLTADHTISAHPKWSPDGGEIAYTSYKSGYPDVYVIHLSTTIRSRVAFFPGINSGPAFSPDGHSLALTLSKDGNPLIYIIPASGGSARRLTHGPGTETSPSWSPDGSKIVYDSDERGSVQLYTASSGGGEGTRLSTAGSGSSYAAEPDWSPDGTKIAYTARSGGQFQIAVYDFSTGRAALVTTDGGLDPSWTCNSRHLVYAKGGSLYLLDTVTRQTARLDNNLTRCSEPAVSR